MMQIFSRKHPTKERRHCNLHTVLTSFCTYMQEVDIGLAADLGTLQRTPRIIGNDSLFRELAYTGEEKENCPLFLSTYLYTYIAISSLSLMHTHLVTHRSELHCTRSLDVRSGLSSPALSTRHPLCCHGAGQADRV